MRKIALCVGILFGIADLVILGAVTWLLIVLHQLENESSDYVERVLPQMISGWNEEQLLRYAPDIFKGHVHPHEDFENELGRYRLLGRLLSSEKANGTARFLHHPADRMRYPASTPLEQTSSVVRCRSWRG
jgi:hypothetical protein